MIPLFKVFMAPYAGVRAAEILNSGFIGQGKVVDEFESELGKFLNAPFVVTTNSATSAEHLALRLLAKPVYNTAGANIFPGLNQGDEVLATALTCTASNWPILMEGYKIKWVDIDETLNMDLDDLARKITPTTKAIMLVFWGGMPVDMYKLEGILHQAYLNNGFYPQVIIDGAHSFGTTFDDFPLSEFSHLTTYSFQAIKHITSIDGGALVLPKKDMFKRAKLLRWYGIDREGDRTDFRCELDIPEIGTKWHMNDVSATVGLANLEYAETILNGYRSNTFMYNAKLKNIDGVLQVAKTPFSNSASWLHTIHVERREDFMKMMESKGITVSRVHERNDIHSAVKEFKTQLPTLDKLSKTMICIPNGWWVSQDDCQYIVDTIKAGW